MDRRRRRFAAAMMSGGSPTPLAPPSVVPGSLDSSTSSESVGTFTALSGYAIGDASHKLVVVLGAETTGDVSIDAVAWNSEALTLATGAEAYLESSSDQLVQIWYLDSPTPATGDIDVTISNSNINPFFITAFLLQGAAAGSAAGDGAGANSGELNSSISVPGAAHYVVSAYNSGTNVDLSPTGTAADQLFVGGVTGTGALGVADEVAGAGSLAYGWSTGAVRIVIAAAAFGPA